MSRRGLFRGFPSLKKIQYPEPLKRLERLFWSFGKYEAYTHCMYVQQFDCVLDATTLSLKNLCLCGESASALNNRATYWLLICSKDVVVEETPVVLY